MEVWRSVNVPIVQNINVMLEQHVTENAEVALTLSRLTEERQQLQLQVKELEEQLKIAAKSQVKIMYRYFALILAKMLINTSNCECIDME